MVPRDMPALPASFTAQRLLPLPPARPWATTARPHNYAPESCRQTPSRIWRLRRRNRPCWSGVDGGFDHIGGAGAQGIQQYPHIGQSLARLRRHQFSGGRIKAQLPGEIYGMPACTPWEYGPTAAGTCGLVTILFIIAPQPAKFKVCIV